MPANAALAEPEETFAKLLASGMTPQLAYTESRIGVAHSCTVDQAQRLPGMWARVQWLKANQDKLPDARTPPPEFEIDPSAPKDEQVIGMLIRDHALACAMGQVSAAVRAAELIGKQQGMFVDRSEQKIDIRHQIAVRLDDAIKRVAPRPVLALPSK